MNTLILNLHPVIELTDEKFEQLAAANRDLRLEKTAKGELIIMPPTGGNTGKRNADLFRLEAIALEEKLINRVISLEEAFN